MAPHQALPGVPDLEMAQILKLNHKDQAVWFLNGFWSQVGSHSEDIWRWQKLFCELDARSANKLGVLGSELDSIMSARFLEANEETLTSLERKAALKEIDMNNDGCMALTEYLMFHFYKSRDEVVGAKQGNGHEIARCQEAINQAISQITEVEMRLAAKLAAKKEQQVALDDAREARAVAEVSLRVQQAAEDELRAALAVHEDAKTQLLEAIDALQQQEQARATETARLEGVISTCNTGTVKRGRAHNQLNELRNSDPLPLRKARLTQEAALRCVRKKEEIAAARADTSAETTRECSARHTELASKERLIEQTAETLAAAVAELEGSFGKLTLLMNEAHAALAVLKAEQCGLGAIWWMERELFEADQLLPRAKQKYNHSTPFAFRPTVAAEVPVDVDDMHPAPAKAPRPAVADTELGAMVSG